MQKCIWLLQTLPTAKGNDHKHLHLFPMLMRYPKPKGEYFLLPLDNSGGCTSPDFLVLKCWEMSLSNTSLRYSSTWKLHPFHNAFSPPLCCPEQARKWAHADFANADTLFSTFWQDGWSNTLHYVCPSIPALGWPSLAFRLNILGCWVRDRESVNGFLGRRGLINN